MPIKEPTYWEIYAQVGLTDKDDGELATLFETPRRVVPAWVIGGHIDNLINGCDIAGLVVRRVMVLSVDKPEDEV